MIINNPNTLIGDFIGTIPAMQALKADVNIHDCQEQLFAMTGLNRSFADGDLSFDLHAAFDLADRENLHMIQANFAYAGLAIPKDIPKPKLFVIPEKCFQYDYCLAPFSRSLPIEQLWERDKWQQLVDSMPNKQFCILGAKSDDIYFITGDNVSFVFGEDMNKVCNILKKCNYGLISVVTGLSHLAHALSVVNYLFINQGMWGRNPDAIYFEKHIPDITVEEVIEIIK